MLESGFYNMDCMDAMREFPNKFFELALVDPPYGIGADTNQNNLGGQKGFTKNAGTYKKYHETNWDDTKPTQLYFKELKRVARSYIIWGGNYFQELIDEGVIIWYKGGSGNFKEGEMAKTNINTFKVFTYSRADAYINDCDIKIHPTQKPIKLYTWLLQNYAKRGDKILDTHVGSASSLIACHRMGFDFWGFELDADYYKAASERLAKEQAQQTLFSPEEIYKPQQQGLEFDE
jgi:site-specific DNA-methyltransferase (adenine-specific)